MLNDKLYERRLLWLIASTIVFRLIYANLLDLIPDEAYYWDLSRHLGLSYFDHPPLQMYLIRAFTWMLGDTVLAVRLPSVINSGIVTLLMYLAGKELFDARTGFYSSILFTITPVYAAGGVLATIDPPFATFWMIALYSGIRAIKTEKAWWWYGLGVSIGLGLLSKYIMILFIPAFAIFLLLSKAHRFWMKRKEPYVAGVIALLFFSPVIVWNSQNDWSSFRFQLGHGFSGKVEPAASFLQYIGSQSLLVSPLLFIACVFAMVYGLFLWYRKRDWRLLLLVSMSSFVLLFFAYSSLKAKVEGNWPMSAYFSAFILLPPLYFESRFFKKKAVAGLVAGMAFIFTCSAFVQAIYPVLPFKNDITDQFHGWRKLGAGLEPVLENLRKDSPKGLIILTDSRQLTSELSFYVPSHPMVYKLAFAGKFDEYNLLAGPEKGINAMIVTGAPDINLTYPGLLFEKIDKIKSLEMKRGSKVLKVYHVYFGRDFRGYRQTNAF